MHQPGIAGHDHDEAVPVVLHPLEQRLDRLWSEVLAFVSRRKRICLVDEENAVERAPDHPIGLDRRHADVLPDEPGPVDLDQMAPAQQPHRSIHLREQSRDRGLACPWISEKDEMLGGRNLGQPVSLALGLHLEKGDERPHLLLHRLEPDEGVELRLELRHRPRRLRPPELIRDPFRGIAAARRLGQPLSQHLQAPGDILEWFSRHTLILPVRLGLKRWGDPGSPRPPPWSADRPRCGPPDEGYASAGARAGRLVNLVNEMPAVAADPTVLANRLRPVLLHLNRQLRREIHSLGVTGGQVSLLVQIKFRPGIGVRELAALERMSVPGMSKFVARLEEAGLVGRAPVEGDQRRVGLTLTAAGHKVLRSVKSKRTAWLSARLRSLDPEELDAIDAAIEPLTHLLAGDEA